MTEFLDVPGGTIAYDVTGEGPLVLCAPGMGDLRQSYRFLVPVLTDAGFRVATMDLRGHGESTRGWDSCGQVALGHDMVGLVRHLGGPAVVVGQSFTPDSALVAAAALPEDVRGTVLLAPWAHTPRLNPLLSLLQRAVVRVPRLWVMFYKSLYRGPRPADFDGYLRGLTASLRGRAGMAALAAMADPGGRDASGDRSRPTQPALIVMGAEDPDFTDPRAEAETMAGDLSGPVQIAMIDGVGHYPQAEAPAATGAAMVAFLRSVHGS